MIVLVTSGRAIIAGAIISSIARVVGTRAIVLAILVIKAFLPGMGTIVTRARVVWLRIAVVTMVLAIVIIVVLISVIVLVFFGFFLEIDIKELGHRVQGFSGKLLAHFLEAFPPLSRHGIEEKGLDCIIIKLSIISGIRDGRYQAVHNENLSFEIIGTSFLGLG
jgi:hypothetical protein